MSIETTDTTDTEVISAQVLRPDAGAPAPSAGLRPHSHGGGTRAEGSALHAVTSYDVDAFPVPQGREEAWRFTPLPRLRGLLDGDPSDDRLTAKIDAPEGV